MSVSDQKLDQVVKGAPPPNVSPTQVASAAKSSSHSHSSSITAPKEPTPSHIDALPSSPPQIYLNLLILESSLRLQYLSLRARLRLHLLLLTLLTLWTTTFTWLLFFRPREDGNGVGGSVYWMLESSEKLCWTGGVVTCVLFWGTGMYERGVRWPRKFIGTTNRGLRAFNMKVVLVRGTYLHEALGWLALLDPLGWYGDNRHVNFQYVPRDLDSGKDPWAHTHRYHWLEEDIAPAGDTIKLLLLPKPFSPDFREGWDTYRLDYWARENARRAELRKLVKARQHSLARLEGGWLWWTGWRGWKRLSLRRSTRPADIEKLALKERPSSERLRLERRRREGLLRGESHSRSSSRSSTPTPDPEARAGQGEARGGQAEARMKVRRGSSSGGAGRRPKKLSSISPGSRLSATESLLEDGGEHPALSKRASNLSTSSSSDGEAAAGRPKKEEALPVAVKIESEEA